MLHENETRQAGPRWLKFREWNTEEHPTVCIFAFNPFFRNLIEGYRYLKIGIYTVKDTITVEIFAIQNLVAYTDRCSFKRTVMSPSDVFTCIEGAVPTIAIDL